MEELPLADIAADEVCSLGETLRRCRESRQITLEVAAEATKIGRNHLRALEEDRFQDLPSPAYFKGFLRIYAAYLGLDPEALLLCTVGQQGEPGSEQPEQQEKDRHLSGGGFNWQRLFLPAVLLTALVVSAIFMIPNSPERPLPPVTQQITPPAQPAAPEQAAVQATHSSVRLPAGQPTGQQATPAAEKPSEMLTLPPPREGFMVRMKVNRNSSLSVTIDDTASQRYELTSGDLIEWKAARTIALDLSDAGSIEIELNGTPLKLQTPPGKPAYIMLDGNGIKQ